MVWTEEQKKAWERLYTNLRAEGVPSTYILRIVLDERVEISIAPDGRIVSAGLVDKEGIGP